MFQNKQSFIRHSLSSANMLIFKFWDRQELLLQAFFLSSLLTDAFLWVIAHILHFHSHFHPIFTSAGISLALKISSSSQLVNRTVLVAGCSDDCWDQFIGFWIEGCLVPVIAAFGIVGKWFGKNLRKAQPKTVWGGGEIRKPTPSGPDSNRIKKWVWMQVVNLCKKI